MEEQQFALNMTFVNSLKYNIMDNARFAAKRYRQYTTEMRKQSVKQSIILFLIKIFDMIAKLLHKAKIVEVCRVERITVE